MIKVTKLECLDNFDNFLLPYNKECRIWNYFMELQFLAVIQ